jgi:hypothetical protein
VENQNVNADPTLDKIPGFFFSDELSLMFIPVSVTAENGDSLDFFVERKSSKSLESVNTHCRDLDPAVLEVKASYSGQFSLWSAASRALSSSSSSSCSSKSLLLVTLPVMARAASGMLICQQGTVVRSLKR